MHKWAVTHGINREDGSDRWQLNVWTEPAWCGVVETIFDRACWLSGGLLGGHPNWKWLDKVIYNVPLGLPVRAEDGWLDNSVGAALYRLESKLLGVGWKYQKVTERRFPITEAQAENLQSEFVRQMRELYADDDD